MSEIHYLSLAKEENPALRRILTIENFQKTSMGLFLLLIMALIYSFYLNTIVNIALLVLGIGYQYFHRNSAKVVWMPILIIPLGFVPYLMGLFGSEEMDRALKAVQHNLAFLSIPVAFLLLPPLTNTQRHNVVGSYIVIIALSTLPVILNYVVNFEDITHSLGIGKAIPTPIDHVRYSIFIALACVFSFISFFTKAGFWGLPGKKIYLFLSVFLFIIIHVLAVRSGIGLTYLGLVLSGTILLWNRRKFGWIMLLFGFLAISPIAAYYAIPSFQNKIKYTRYDWSLSQAGKGADYSDSERIRSITIGIDIWKDHKVAGIGTGDLKREMGRRYFEKYTEGGRAFMPHNQFVKFLATSGILGLLAFVISFYFPFFWKYNFLDPYILTLISILTVSFLVEATLERSYMITLYVFLACLFYSGRVSKTIPT